MSSPLENLLSDAEREILGALLEGLELRELDGVWQFVGPWQDPQTSGVGHDVMSKLFRFGFISYGIDGRAVITHDGEMRLSQYLDIAIDAMLKRSRDRACYVMCYEVSLI